MGKNKPLNDSAVALDVYEYKRIPFKLTFNLPGVTDERTTWLVAGKEKKDAKPTSSRQECDQK